MKRTSGSRTGFRPQLPVYSSEENLQRIARTDILSEFVRKNNGIWDHAKWLELCDIITKKGYVPIDFDKVGLVLEDIKARYPEI